MSFIDLSLYNTAHYKHIIKCMYLFILCINFTFANAMCEHKRNAWSFGTQKIKIARNVTLSFDNLRFCDRSSFVVASISTSASTRCGCCGHPILGLHFFFHLISLSVCYYRCAVATVVSCLVTISSSTFIC